MHPAALLAGFGEDLSQCSPEPERPVAHRENRCGEATVSQAPQDLGPAVGGLAVAVGQRDQLLRPVGAHTDDHEAAEPVLFQADVEVHPVRPEIDVVDARQVPLGPLGVLGLPGNCQPVDRRGRQPGLGAEELAQRGGEVAGRQSPQVEDGEHLGDLGGLAHVGGQDGRGEPAPLPAVIDPGRAHLDRPRSGCDDPRSGVAVPDHEPVAGGIDLVRVGLEVGAALGQERDGQHLLRRQSAQLIEIDRRQVGLTNRVRGGVMD